MPALLDRERDSLVDTKKRNDYFVGNDLKLLCAAMV